MFAGKSGNPDELVDSELMKKLEVQDKVLGFV